MTLPERLLKHDELKSKIIPRKDIKTISKTTVGYSKALIMYLRIIELFAEFPFKTVFKNRYGCRKFKEAV